MGGAAAGDHHPEEDAGQGAAGMAHRHAKGLPGVQRRMWQTRASVVDFEFEFELGMDNA